MIEELKKKYGPAIQVASDNRRIEVPHFSTGILSLDHYALGIGGIPKNRLTVFYGVESAGKTVLCLQIIAEAQKQLKDPIIFVDVEHSLDINFCQQLGIDLKKLVIFPSQEQKGKKEVTGEEFVDFVVDAIESNAPLIIIDSLAALTPEAALTDEAGTSHMGKQAQLQSELCRKIAARLRAYDSTVIATNHQCIPFGTTGGYIQFTKQKGADAIKYYASTVLKFSSGKKLEDGDEKIGKLTRIYVEKHKVAPPFREIELCLINNIGFDRWSDLGMVAVKNKIVKMSGRKLVFNEIESEPISISNGKDGLHATAKTGFQFKKFLGLLKKDNSLELCKQCLKAVRK